MNPWFALTQARIEARQVGEDIIAVNIKKDGTPRHYQFPPDLPTEALKTIKGTGKQKDPEKMKNLYLVWDNSLEEPGFRYVNVETTPYFQVRDKRFECAQMETANGPDGLR